ncbi:MAG: M28 family peptidase [Deltaproteobacteria bacterium]|nr:M28 family peptidase [Deltaproteobacteria bacterium]
MAVFVIASVIVSQEGAAQSMPAFKGKDAFAYLIKQTDFGPRNPNSRGHTECLKFLYDSLCRSADSVRLQHFTHTGYENEELWLTNVIASFRPEFKERILFCAHWDTRPRAERDTNIMRKNQPILGANDGASGVAVLLHLADLMKISPPPVGVDIVLFDGEDYGVEGDLSNYLLGSRFFVRKKVADYQPRFGILLDMVGDKFLQIFKEQNSLHFAPQIVELVWEKARELGITQFSPQTGHAIFDDHIPLNEAGIRAVNLIDFNYPDESHRFWHTHKDVPENCSPESLQAVGVVITGILYSQQP